MCHPSIITSAFTFVAAFELFFVFLGINQFHYAFLNPLMQKPHSIETDHYHRIMLKFRPIAPKPSDGANPSLLPDQERRNGNRSKRKYVRVRRRQPTKRKSKEEGRSEKSGVEDAPPPEKSAVTLQLLPERSESEKSCCSSALKSQEIVDRDRFRVGGEVHYRGTAVAAAATWIVVECVTETYVDGGLGLGFSDGEMIEQLRGDTCPGFISDGENNVVWVNEAYRRMEAAREVAVRLVVRGKLPYFTPSFACRVRMIQQTKQGQKWNRIVACDVWRMEFAGFAWKLDVQTALGLGI